MADPVVTKTRPIKRENLAQFLPDQRAIKTFENLTEDVGGTLPGAVTAALNAAEVAQAAAVAAQADADAAALAAAAAQSSADGAQADATDALGQIVTLGAIQYLTLAASATLANERALTAGDGVTFTDAGAGGALTVSISRNASLKDSLGATIAQVADGALGLFGATPVVQPTTAGAAATFVAGAGAAVNDASTFDGYTIKQVVKALRALGLLA